jgi:hypothetical protein
VTGEGITCQSIGLADGERADAIPNAAGGEGGHEAAKPDIVIYRYRAKPIVTATISRKRRPDFSIVV